VSKHVAVWIAQRDCCDIYCCGIDCAFVGCIETNKRCTDPQEAISVNAAYGILMFC